MFVLINCNTISFQLCETFHSDINRRIPSSAHYSPFNKCCLSLSDKYLNMIKKFKSHFSLLILQSGKNFSQCFNEVNSKRLIHCLELNALISTHVKSWEKSWSLSRGFAQNFHNLVELKCFKDFAKKRIHEHFFSSCVFYSRHLSTRLVKSMNQFHHHMSNF